jgi:hypothetical protein
MAGGPHIGVQPRAGQVQDVRGQGGVIDFVTGLPAPLGPRKPVTVPSLTVKLSWLTTVLRPYCLVSS